MKPQSVLNQILKNNSALNLISGADSVPIYSKRSLLAGEHLCGVFWQARTPIRLAISGFRPPSESWKPMP